MREYREDLRNSAVGFGITKILHQCQKSQKPGFWQRLCVKADILRQKPGFLLGNLRNPVSCLVIENVTRDRFYLRYYTNFNMRVIWGLFVGGAGLFNLFASFKVFGEPAPTALLKGLQDLNSTALFLM
jgi:hypothetical protein